MRSRFRKLLDDTTLKAESLYRMHEYRKSAKLRLKRMGNVSISNDVYRNEVVPYWKRFGVKPKKFWYDLYSGGMKTVDPRYIPDDLWYGIIVPYFSNTLFRRYGEDKCQLDRIFSEFKHPQTLVKNIAGVYYDQDMNIIDLNCLIEICMSYPGDFLIKPSIDSGEGRLISFFDKGDYSEEQILNTINYLKANFIVQAVIKQHPALASLNPTSLNTVRIVSFLFQNEVHILSSILRIGAEGARIDNVGAGGFACRIKNTGWLDDRGVNRKSQWTDECNNGIKFADIKIPAYHQIISLVNSAHSKQAHFKLIGWDFAINTADEPVFIEYNVCPGMNQITCGPNFGTLTERVLEDVFITKSLRYAQN
jgi:hypothetical protein